MSDVWTHEDYVACTHPGWGRMRGWGAVSSTWFALLYRPSPVQFILTEVRARLVGNTAWVTLDENLIGGESGSSETVAAVNIFERTAGQWRMVYHHGSPVAPRAGPPGR